MTSKDNLEFILKEFTRHLSKLETELILDKAEPIVKALEVLEIIKDKLVVANLIGNGKIYHTISIPKEINKLTENQYKKIEEWVNNGE